MYSRLYGNFYKCQAIVIKFDGNVNDRCGNLTKKTEFKSADSEASPGGNSGNFLIKMVCHVMRPLESKFIYFFYYFYYYSHYSH